MYKWLNFRLCSILYTLNMLEVPDDIWKARQYKRYVARGDRPSPDMKQAFAEYKNHPYVMEHKW